ncbi:hypothetical protein DSM104443_02930 [Usitatibacter rugosus]|uniref:Uncharacterized protein n=1 Tax=Usitatibacter rugosus TaxID=2732067 RepID=A0A6M4H1Y4_9PROT|nr:hypothetical protein [Usitatibacter rugosus]QJR11847.1 hypothetical protein DSM104443_02930 [Usitatibacter rugosus]
MNTNMNEPTTNPLHDAYLTSRLDELKGELSRMKAPDALEAALTAEFRRRHAKARRPALWWMPPLALAATVALVSWMVHAPIVLQQPTPAIDDLVAGESDPGPFLALRPLERIALEPGATVVATEFPRALLADWGLPVSPERASEPVRAEMLYSAQGEPLAVRLLD